MVNSCNTLRLPVPSASNNKLMLVEVSFGVHEHSFGGAVGRQPRAQIDRAAGLSINVYVCMYVCMYMCVCAKKRTILGVIGYVDFGLGRLL